MIEQIRTILFDIGGTLLQKQNHGSRDPLIIAEMVNFLGGDETAEEMIAKLTAREQEYKSWKYRSLSELSYEEVWSDILLPEHPKTLIQQHALQLQEWWSTSKGKRWIAPETIVVLETLAARGYLLGTISHTNPKYLDEAGIRHLFITARQAAEFGKRKPHPAMFLAAARDCNTPIEACAYVGDRPSRDIVGAREAGIGQVIQLKKADGISEENPCVMQADTVIQTLTDLLEIFPHLNTNDLKAFSHLESTPLYDAALSTMWWSKETDSAEDFCQKGRKLGFARFELNHQIPPEDLASFNTGRYHIGSVHDPCPAVVHNKQLELEDRQLTSLNKSLRQDGIDTVKRSIETAYRLGARSVVIHPGHITGDHSLDDQLREMFRKGLKHSPEYLTLRDKVITDRKIRSKPHLDCLVQSLQEIITFASDTGVCLGLENRFHYYEVPIFEEMQVLLEAFKQPWVGWQLDIGHIQAHNVLGLMSFQQWLVHFSHRIIGVHWHDVIGIVDHQPPGAGEVDFSWVAKYIPDSAIHTLEINKKATFDEMKIGLEVLSKAGCITKL